MDPQVVALIGALGGLGGVLSTLVAWRQARSAARKTDVEAQDLIIQRLQDENERLCQRQDELEQDNEQLRKELDAVTKELQLVKEENGKLRKEVDGLTQERQQLLEELEWDNPLLASKA